ncbi:3-methyladenine DNA glycosylase [Millisia brevis]|uniref:3-methyladenine DNA glycosylase n=1 Tax=Millisia brevis TaxID=264148 RepID=UPI00082C47A4|nr:3-methyladenine DNA glycosylase [Millisia brevis]
MEVEILEAARWRAAVRAHEARMAPAIEPYLERRRTGATHPVDDFLFSYYSFRPAQLRRWHPGYGIALADADEYAEVKGYEVDGGVARVSVAMLDARRGLLADIRRLLIATLQRPAQFGCFGMHEWAMVYRLDPSDTRHASWPLRLGHDGTDRVVETHRIACSHYDAFRFFTPPARSLNLLQPQRDDRPDFEQPGCLHAGMDLYKHAFRLAPLVDSELIADCFDLARDIRELDMRASPYDLSALGYEPVAVETPEGKARYAHCQREFAQRAQPLRERLIERVDRLLTASAPVEAGRR